MTKRRHKMQCLSHVPPTPDEFKDIMAGKMDISAELNEFWRQCNDDELATWYRNPKQWSYVVRAPDGDIVCSGSGTRHECERWALRNAVDYADENAMVVIDEGVKGPAFGSLEERLSSGWAIDFHWAWHLLGDWRFVLWPPLKSLCPGR